MKENTKDWILYSTAMAMIGSAIVLTFISFLITSEVATGVLGYVSEALIYAGSIFGVSIYYRTKLGDFETKTKAKLDKLILEMSDKIEKRVEKRLHENEN